MIVRHFSGPLRANSARLSRSSPELLRRPSKPAPLGHTFVRHATHGTAGRANGPKNGPGKRLGAKKTGDQYVIPGNIIYRQRGAVWHPGDNVGMGRDHTIFALESGYVKYYKDPRKHPKRQYIGVVFNKSQTLPAAPHAARRRRLNMIAVPRKDVELKPTPDTSINLDPLESSTSPVTTDSALQTGRRTRRQRQRYPDGRIPPDELVMSSNYSFRESNWQIGRSAERAGIRVPKYKPGDRFAAWRKRTVKRTKAAEKRSLSRKAPSGRKGKKK